MPDGRQDLKRFFGEIKQQFFRFAGSYSKAVSSGANVTSSKIMENLKETEQISDISIGILISAVNSGVEYAGEQMIKSGIDLVEHMKEYAKKQ
ncbi:hypothetical protein ACFQZR_22355 [Paenibacillus sp. GCM10027629]|uniref:hypothetical protein n=1 Tax=Paenibacillus sp. GCM10027629 TaxID=3273414 RepID=UPI003626DE6A